MNNRLYIGNLSYSTTEEKLQATFSPFGAISSVHLVADKETGRSRGFAFVEFATEEEAQAAIKGLNGQEVDGRQLRVNVAEERKTSGGPRQGGGGRGRPRDGDY
jgi:RNA recognition motif-containing protein